MSSGIKELFGLYYWLDNSKQSTFEALLKNKKELPKERMTIIRALEEEQSLNNSPPQQLSAD